MDIFDNSKRHSFEANRGESSARGMMVSGSIASTGMFGVREFNPAESDSVRRTLSKSLGPEYVSERVGSGGSRVSYVEGWKALNLANEVFGYNGWSSTIVNMQTLYCDNDGGKLSLGVSCIMRITLKDGTFHEDIGFGAVDNVRRKCDAFEKAMKEAVTDGLKRTLRSFGNVMGNCLYDKQFLKQIKSVRVPDMPLDPDDLHRHPQIVEKRLREEELIASRQAHMQQQQQQRIDAHIAKRQKTDQPTSGPVSLTQDFFGDVDDSDAVAAADQFDQFLAEDEEAPRSYEAVRCPTASSETTCPPAAARQPLETNVFKTPGSMISAAANHISPPKTAYGFQYGPNTAVVSPGNSSVPFRHPTIHVPGTPTTARSRAVYPHPQHAHDTPRSVGGGHGNGSVADDLGHRNAMAYNRTARSDTSLFSARVD